MTPSSTRYSCPAVTHSHPPLPLFPPLLSTSGLLPPCESEAASRQFSPLNIFHSACLLKEALLSHFEASPAERRAAVFGFSAAGPSTAGGFVFPAFISLLVFINTRWLTDDQWKPSWVWPLVDGRAESWNLLLSPKQCLTGLLQDFFPFNLT